MSCCICWFILASSCSGGALDSFLLMSITMGPPFQVSHEVNHLFCKLPTMLTLTCGDKATYVMVMYICYVMMLLISFSMVFTSYAQIFLMVNCTMSAKRKRKSFTTCSSHMIVVMIFYGNILYRYMLPQSYHIPLKDKIFSAFYTTFMPLLSPLIYRLRNRDVMVALGRVRSCHGGACCVVNNEL
ncbi:Olfactory receptor 2T6 [Sciurus carolinensis]|uniref:Olfactory receptor 2T6 n=1 Tax=Sciurus carolinensis TaxID=30640 RepID=A0AA41SWM8_SCICA|nr:Olfactory receptor 2T6 [Sciurus carolinensis]